LLSGPGSFETSAGAQGQQQTNCPESLASGIDDKPLEPVYPELWISGLRGLYALTAKLIPSLAVAVEDSALGQAAYANAARNSLKDLFRGPFAPLFSGVRQPTFAESLAKASGDPYAVIDSAARTNAAVNAIAATTAAAAGASSIQGATSSRCP
jgi:hypothetical protein